MAKSTYEGTGTPGDPEPNKAPESSNSEIRMDDFIKRVKPDPNSTEQVLLLSGYIGESASADKIRVYSDQSLADFVEISRSDVLFSLASDEDPLGGSTLWVKQTANTQYSNAAAYGQGDMYNDYLQNQYTPVGGNFSGGTAANLQSGVYICASRQLICPTQKPACLQSVNVICATRQLSCPTINIRYCITRNNLRTICRPCYATPVTIPQGPGPLNPGNAGGGFNDPYNAYGAAGDPAAAYGDYTQGDMYNDYMQNQYDPGTQNFGPPAATLPHVCVPDATVFICKTRQLNCSTLPPYCIQLKTVNLVCKTVICPTVLNNCITRHIQFCPTIVQPHCLPRTTVTVTITNPGTINVGAGGGGLMNDPNGGSYGDYTSGDMYNDYMGNAYDGGAGYAPNFAAPTNTAICKTRNPRLCEPTLQNSPACNFTRNLHVPACNPHRPGYITNVYCNLGGGVYDPYGY